MVTKLKAESYNNFKGINNKVSEYNNTQYEVRDLKNLTFQNPGAWDSRPGTTLFMQYVPGEEYSGMSFGSEIVGLYEYVRIQEAGPGILERNYKMIAVATDPAGTTYAGGVFLARPGFAGTAAVLTPVYLDTESSPYHFQPFDFETFVDTLFAANSNVFFKFNGLTSSRYSLPNNGYSNVVLTVTGTTPVPHFSGFALTYSFSYFNDMGFVGAPGGYDSSGSGTSLGTWPNIGVTGGAVLFSGFTIPEGWGISGIVVYRSGPNGGQTGPRYEIARFSGQTFIDAGLTLSINPEPTNIWFTLVPKYLELSENTLFLAGFSSLPSTLYFSDIGEPESIQPENFFEVRTNDGDEITGVRAYRGELIIFKEKSFHRLLGNSPESYQLVQVSDQYGCLSNRAIVEFEGVLWFLDSKGIVEYNGALPRIVSSKVDDIFKRFNYDYAIQWATAMHVKSRREVWFCFPSGENLRSAPLSSGHRYINDIIVVYDYFSDAWTTFEGVFPTVLSEMSAYIPQEISPGVTITLDDDRVYAGSYSGQVFYFDTTLTSDYTGAFTCMVKSRFLADLGNSVTKEFRRFYLDVKPQAGATQVFGIQMYTDYSESASLVRTMPITPFQSRMEFGLNAKALSVEIAYSNATLPLQVNGHTIEYRELRRV